MERGKGDKENKEDRRRRIVGRASGKGKERKGGREEQKAREGEKRERKNRKSGKMKMERWRTDIFFFS